MNSKTKKLPKLEEMSGDELNTYMDDLVARGEAARDTPEWRRAYRFWEKTNDC